ncbi:MAG: thymidylate synthase [Patescibacteria group bacterium]
MFAYLEEYDLGNAWFSAIDKIMSSGRKYLITKGSYEGIHRIGMPIVINITNPDNRPLYPIVPEGIPAPTTQADIEEYVSYLITGEREPNEHYTYGEDLHWLYPWVVKHYKEGGEGNNHCYMTVGRPETVFFYEKNLAYNEIILVKDKVSGDVVLSRYITNSWNERPDVKGSSQCLRGIDTWIDNGKLHFWVYFRSWDLLSGFPVNLGGIQLLKETMAAEIGVKDGPMIVSCKDLHVYEHSWVVALLRLRKDESLLSR